VNNTQKKSSENIFICVDTFTLFASLNSLSLSVGQFIYFYENLVWPSEKEEKHHHPYDLVLYSVGQGYSAGAQVVITSRQLLLLLLLLLYSINKQRCDALISILQHGQTKQMYI
jgi:hypothetical protein